MKHILLPPGFVLVVPFKPETVLIPLVRPSGNCREIGVREGGIGLGSPGPEDTTLLRMDGGETGGGGGGGGCEGVLVCLAAGDGPGGGGGGGKLSPSEWTRARIGGAGAKLSDSFSGLREGKEGGGRDGVDGTDEVAVGATEPGLGGGGGGARPGNVGG